MPYQFPDHFNLADYYLYQRLEEGLAEKAAVLYGELGYRYRDIAERSRALANYLLHMGLEPEQRVHIVLSDTPPFVWSIFATWTAGAVVTMGNPQAPVEDLAYVLECTGTSVLITLPEVAAVLAPHLKNSHQKNNQRLKMLLLVPDVATGEDPEAAVSLPDVLQEMPFPVEPLASALNAGRRGEERPRPQVRRDDMACWLFTTGSTGQSKAAMHTHRDFAFNTEAYAKATVGYRSDDITVSVPRLFFGYATGTNLFFPFAVGATTALYSEAPSPQSLARAIQSYKPTVVTNVPTMLGKLLTEMPELDFTGVRFQLSAGEALPPTLLSKFLEHFGCDIYDGIGSAEMFHIYCTNRPGDIKPGSLGRVVNGYELRILPADAEGPGADDVAPGDTGVLWVKGDSVSLGYYRDRDKSWKTFHGHWCRTGDLFSKDAEGYLWFQGRADDLFKVNGRWMAPQEVEDCLLQHPAVAACAVIPIEVDGLTKPKALVVLMDGYLDNEDGLDNEGRQNLTEALQQHVMDRIAKYKYPRVIEFMDELPKNDRGKIARKQLIAREQSL